MQHAAAGHSNGSKSINRTPSLWLGDARLASIAWIHIEIATANFWERHFAELSRSRQRKPTMPW